MWPCCRPGRIPITSSASSGGPPTRSCCGSPGSIWTICSTGLRPNTTSPRTTAGASFSGECWRWPHGSRTPPPATSLPIGWPTRRVLRKRWCARRSGRPPCSVKQRSKSGKLPALGQVKHAEKGLIWALAARPAPAMEALCRARERDLSGLATEAILQQARSLQGTPPEALPVTLLERLTKGEAGSWKKSAGRPAPRLTRRTASEHSRHGDTAANARTFSGRSTVCRKRGGAVRRRNRDALAPGRWNCCDESRSLKMAGV